MEKKHFKLTSEFIINSFGIKLFRIECTIDCKWAKKGEKGGWIEKKENLSGDAWVCGNAEVYGNARVYGNAQVSGDAEVCGNAQVYGNARVSGDAWVCGNAQVYGNARVYGDADVYGNARVYGDAEVSGNAQIYGNAEVSGNADYCVFQGFGSDCRTTTAFKSTDGLIKIKCGCFYGTLQEFANKVQETHGDNKFGKEYKAIIEVIKAKFEL